MLARYIFVLLICALFIACEKQEYASHLGIYEVANEDAPVHEVMITFDSILFYRDNLLVEHFKYEKKLKKFITESSASKPAFRHIELSQNSKDQIEIKWKSERSKNNVIKTLFYRINGNSQDRILKKQPFKIDLPSINYVGSSPRKPAKIKLNLFYGDADKIDLDGELMFNSELIYKTDLAKEIKKFHLSTDIPINLYLNKNILLSDLWAIEEHIKDSDHQLVNYITKVDDPYSMSFGIRMALRPNSNKIKIDKFPNLPSTTTIFLTESNEFMIDGACYDQYKLKEEIRDRIIKFDDQAAFYFVNSPDATYQQWLIMNAAIADVYNEIRNKLSDISWNKAMADYYSDIEEGIDPEDALLHLNYLKRAYPIRIINMQESEYQQLKVI